MRRAAPPAHGGARHAGSPSSRQQPPWKRVRSADSQATPGPAVGISGVVPWLSRFSGTLGGHPEAYFRVPLLDSAQCCARSKHLTLALTVIITVTDIVY